MTRILTPSNIQEIFDCDPTKGDLTWRARTPEMFPACARRPQIDSANAWNAKYAGKPAMDTLGLNGYKSGGIWGKRYLAHRIIWAWVNGEWPNEIDHINGNRTDNRISNLRDVRRLENCKNKKLPSNNKSGVIGVHWHKQTNKWHAQIKIRGRKKHLGFFSSLEGATEARKAAERTYGFHSNHGRKSRLPKVAAALGEVDF